MRWMFRRARRVGWLGLAAAFFLDARRGAARRARARAWAGQGAAFARRQVGRARGRRTMGRV